MCFALYGSVPRYGNKGSVSPIVTMGAIEARVSLTFESGGSRYIATRVAMYRRPADSKVRLTRASIAPIVTIGETLPLLP